MRGANNRVRRFLFRISENGDSGRGGEAFICTIDFSFSLIERLVFINRSIASIVVQIPKFEKNFNVIETRFCYSLLSLPFFVSIEPRRLAGNFISITFGTCMAT